MKVSLLLTLTSWLWTSKYRLGFHRVYWPENFRYFNNFLFDQYGFVKYNHKDSREKLTHSRLVCRKSEIVKPPWVQSTESQPSSSLILPSHRPPYPLYLGTQDHQKIVFLIIAFIFDSFCPYLQIVWSKRLQIFKNADFIDIHNMVRISMIGEFLSL